MPFSDPDGTTKAITGILCIAVILLVSAMTGIVSTGDQVVAVILAIIAGIVMHSLGVPVGKAKGIVGAVRSFIDPDGTLKAIVGMVVLAGLEVYLLFRAIDGTTMYAVVVLIAGIAGYTQGRLTGYDHGTVQRTLITGPSMMKPGEGGPTG